MPRIQATQEKNQRPNGVKIGLALLVGIVVAEALLRDYVWKKRNTEVTPADINRETFFELRNDPLAVMVRGTSVAFFGAVAGVLVTAGFDIAKEVVNLLRSNLNEPVTNLRPGDRESEAVAPWR